MVDLSGASSPVNFDVMRKTKGVTYVEIDCSSIS